jgi:holin-like protein
LRWSPLFAYAEARTGDADPLLRFVDPLCEPAHTCRSDYELKLFSSPISAGLIEPDGALPKLGVTMPLQDSIGRHGGVFPAPTDGEEVASKARSRVADCARQLALAALQISGFWALNFAGGWLVKRTALPIPGNLVGMMALYVLLALRIVKLAWFETAGSFLIRHLAFFFVPITVGLMDARYLLAARGLVILLILAVSAAIGILLAGWVSQLLVHELSRTGDRM